MTVNTINIASKFLQKKIIDSEEMRRDEGDEERDASRVRPGARKSPTTPLTVNALSPSSPYGSVSAVTLRQLLLSGDSARAAVRTWQHRRPRRHGHLTFRGNETPLYSQSRAREYRRARTTFFPSLPPTPQLLQFSLYP